MPSERQGVEVKRGESPSQTAISESKLNKKALCDYVVNVADGCSHGCQFCYVPSMPSICDDPYPDVPEIAEHEQSTLAASQEDSQP